MPPAQTGDGAAIPEGTSMTWRVPKGAKAAKDGHSSLSKSDAAAALLRGSTGAASSSSAQGVAAGLPNKNVFVRWDGYSNHNGGSDSNAARRKSDSNGGGGGSSNKKQRRK